MGTAYVPGLKVLERTTLNLERRLPLKGKICVELGQRVSHDQIVAQTEIPGHVDMVNVAGKLGLEAADVPSHMLCQAGEFINRGQDLAINDGFFGFFKSTLPSPVSGTLESVSQVSGQAVLRAPAQPVAIKAYVDGTVTEIIGDDGVIITTQGALVQGIFGVGGESAGPLVCLAPNPHHVLAPEELKEEHRGSIVIGGSLASAELLKRAVELGVNGLVVGGIDDEVLRGFLGYDLGVAITGSENLGLTLIITEGFGLIDMAQRTFELLQRHQGETASISGATQIRAGVIRPEIIIPSSSESSEELTAPELSLEIGTKVRLIRDPRFGELAKVRSLPHELTTIPTGAQVRVAEVEFQDGCTMLIPRANLEIIAEIS